MIRYIKENDERINRIPLECVKGATLLSIEEYKKYKDKIPEINDGWWWLCTAGYFGCGVCCVDHDGSVSTGCYVYGSNDGIRPALILNLQFSNINFDVGDKFNFGEHSFTILSNDLAVCDDFIRKGYFRKDYQAPDANDYEKSDVKKVVDKWFNESYRSSDSMIEIIKSDYSFFDKDDWGF